MDMTTLMLSMLFGTVGMGYFMYGKKTMEVIPMGVGAMLMICPYFISNVILMLIVCGGLAGVPFVTGHRQ